MKVRAELFSQIIKTAEEGHWRTTCSNCGAVVSQCRCMGPKIEKTVPYCSECKKSTDENNGPNYDLGTGLYENMGKYKSVKDFEEHADKGPGAFFTDDNAIDFPMDEYIDPDISAPEPTNIDGGNPAGEANLIGGYLDEYLPENDFEGKMPTNLDFGRDYVGEDGNEQSSPVDLKSIENLLNKYLSHGLYGLPDGVDLPDEDLQEPKDLNPDYGTRGPDSLIYEDKWNI
jgi:hypothetical protein